MTAVALKENESVNVDPVEQLVEFLATNDARSDMDQWRRAELMLAALAPELPKQSGHGSARAQALSFRSAESHKAAANLAKTISERGILVDGKPPAERTILNNAEVVYVWDPEDRVAGASFGAHAVLTSTKYDGTRSATLQRLRGKSKTGRVTVTDVSHWRSEKLRMKRGALTFQELFDRRVVRTIAAQVRPSFSLTTQGDLDEMAATLRRRAAQLEQGIQPKETN